MEDIDLPATVLPGFVDTLPAEATLHTFVPVYTLEAAAGLWGPQVSPTESGWAKLENVKTGPDHFIAKVRGHSMEPKIPSGAWCLFRRYRGGSREGRIVLVQLSTGTDPESGARFTVKKYHSKKVVTEEGWTHQHIELQPLNPAYQPIIINPGEADDLIVVGEWVQNLGAI